MSRRSEETHGNHSHPQFNVDEQLSDLRQLRLDIAEILIASHALISQTVDMPPQVGAQVREAVKAMDFANTMVKARMTLLYKIQDPALSSNHLTTMPSAIFPLLTAPLLASA